MIINHNISAINTHRQLGANTNAVAKNLEKLSSGLQINRAGDDAAGLAISEKMRAQVRGLEMATKNAQDGISLIQTAEGALQETHSILQRMRELAVQSSSDTNMDDVDREAMQSELEALTNEINDIAGRTEFNTQKLIDGSFNNKVFHIGANQGQNIEVSIKAMNADGIGLSDDITVDQQVPDYVAGTAVTVATGTTGTVGGLTVGPGTYNVINDNDTAGALAGIEVDGKYYAVSDLSIASSGNPAGTGVIIIGSTAEALDVNATTEKAVDYSGIDISERGAADASIQLIDDAINEVSSQRSDLGAIQNRLEHTINNLGASSENLTAAESRIRDTDMAKEMMEFTKNNILTQAAQAMLAQANQVPQGVLQLLR